MNLIAKLFVVLTLTISSAFAADVNLAYITNDDDSSYYYLGLQVDQDQAVQKVFKKEFNSRGKQILDERYTVEQFQRGINLVERSGRKVVIVTGSNINITDGADIRIDTLYSGISGQRKVYDASVERVGEDWYFSLNGKRAKKLHFKSNKFFRKTIGIKSIQIK